MFRNIKLLSLTLIISLIFGSTFTFASAIYEPPIDENNPVITVTYDPLNANGNAAGPKKLSFKVTNGSVSGKMDLDGILYDINKEYVPNSVHSKGDDYFVSGNTLYEFHIISEATPSPVYDPDTGKDWYAGPYVFEYELIETKEHPENRSKVLTVQHKDNIKKVIEEKYFLNGKETTKENYTKNKVGSYKEKTTTKYVKDLKEEFIDKKETFLSVTEKDYVITWSDGTQETMKKPVYNFQVDEYYTVTQQYLKTYELTTSTTQVVTPTPAKLNIKVTALTPKAAKKSFTAKWKKLSANNLKKISGYQVQYSTSKNFATSKTVKVGKKSTSKKFTKLKAKTYYYVRIRAYNGSKYGPWSNVKKIKTK